MTISQKFRNLFAVMIFASMANASFAEDRLNIVASFSILGDMVEQVAGEHADVTTIVGPDADAHVHQPSVADARAVADADIIFVNGLGFETWSDT
ncbi:MAG: metal ABC transporter substrate-binding protein, partial [Rhodobacteraceae bacterium]|nr:metal ABC transporter substrate-binding protein [Paracoccaceae bacterium]